MAVTTPERERRWSRPSRRSSTSAEVDGRDRGRRSPVEDPSTGETIAEVADAGPDDAWRRSPPRTSTQRNGPRRPPRERGEILRRAYELMIERIDDLALLMTLEMGKPVAESEAEIKLRGRVLPLVLRGGGPHRRPLPGRDQRRRAACSS